MFCVFVHALLSLQPFFHRSSAAVPAADHENSPWFMGCVNASSGSSNSSSSSRLDAPEGARDLDPTTCSARCLDGGYQVAALTSEGCYCGNQPHGLVASECFNASSKGETKDDRGDRQRTAGPFLHSVRLSTSPNRVQAGKMFVVEVSGNLAGRPDQPTGILGLGGQDLSYVTVRIEETTRKGQSSHHVKVLDGGSFVVSSDWILETPGEYELRIKVSNPLSTLSSILRLSVQQPSPPSLVISVLHGPLGVPSCIPFPLTDSSSVRVEAAYLGDRVTLQADMSEALALEFSWWLTHEDEEKNTEGLKTVCTPNSDCLNSTVNWTFEREGVHNVSVNASGAYGWTHKTIHVVVVRHVVSDLKVSLLDNQPISGGVISMKLELFTTMIDLLVLNLELNGEHGGADAKDNLGIMSRCDFTKDNETISDNTENRSIKTTHPINSSDHDFNDSNHGNITYDHNLNQDHNNICCHGGTYLYLRSDACLHIYNISSCYLHLHLHCHLPNAAEQHHLTVSVLSTSDASSVLLSTTLSLYKHIRALRPSGSWKSVVSTHAEFSLEVVSPTSRVGSRVIWTFSLEDVIVMSRTTKEWNINVSLPTAGCYKVTVQAFNPISRASFCTHILAQDPVRGLVLNIPSMITTNRKHFVSFGIAAGSNVTVSLLVNATLQYRSSSYTTGEETTTVLLFNHTGTVVVELQAENRVSSQKKTVRVCVKGNRKSSPQVRVNPTWQPRTGQRPVRGLADNVQVYATKQAYPTNSDVTLTAVTEASDPVEFLWHFGDSTTTRTTSRTVTKRYHKPGRYDVTVVMSRSQTSLTSNVFPLVVQRAVKLNRLLHQASVLQNQTVAVSCRVNVGTDVSFLWSFGDETYRLGESTEQHVFFRTGEFRVTVNVSNLVSSASLSSHIFVVDRPCQPPPVKNMGPLKLQVRKHEVIHLGVTYETEVDCDISGGLHYSWTLFDSVGGAFPLPLIDTHRQSLMLPSHLLQYDTYTAIARVQVVGNVVYSNYSVKVQVMPSPPVVIIQGGTNIFINAANTTMVTLDGQRSHDPDFPKTPVSFSWTCKPVSSIASSCFLQDIPTSSPVLGFPASLLKRNFDQFQFTLTVRSGERSASSETFLTLKSNVIGKVSVYCPQCQGEQVNWDQLFSVSAMCEDCNIPPKIVQYTWSLYMVNASSKPVTEAPFCYTVDLGAPATIMESAGSSSHTTAISTQKASESRAKKLNLNVTDSGTLSKNNRKKSATAGLTAGSGEEPFYRPLGEFDPPEPLYSSTEYQPLALDNSGVLYSDHFGKSDVISEFPMDSDSSADWEFSFPVLESADLGGRPDSDHDVPLSAEEGEPGISAGRPTGVIAETFRPGDESEFEPVLHEDEGSNLMDSRPSVVIQEPILLDLARDPVDKGIFESYTYTGISSPLLSFRPFTLKPGSRYMVEVTAKARDVFLGRSQLFLKTNPAPKGVLCQVQPTEGQELHTHFSIFCTSGKEDFVYEYSVCVGDRPPRMLYQGRDFQYYFSLPSGDPNDDYKVTVYTKITSSMYGTATKPCPVTVRVHPSFFRDTSSSLLSRLDPDLELSESGLRNLSALLQLGNSMEVRNYISLLTSILNRLSLDSEGNTHAQRHTRNVLICVACEIESREQASMVDNISILKDLLQVTSQVTFVSARRVTVHVQVVSDRFSESSASVWYYLDQETLNTLVALLSYSLQAAINRKDFTTERSSSADTEQASESGSHEENIRNATAPSNGCIPESIGGVYIKREGSISTKRTAQLVADILQTASDLMLKYVLFHKVQEHRVSTGLIALHTAYQNQTSTVISSGSASFYMPAPLIQFLSARSRETKSRQCVLSTLTELKHSPYSWAHDHGRLSGLVVDLSLHECSTRRKIPVRPLLQPINIELQQPPEKKSSLREYVLRRSQINYHTFNITQEHLQQAIQLSVVFTAPLSKAFPIMLLFRMFERPTPSVHHLQRTHRWGSNSTRFTLPPSYLSAAGVGHLALLNADFGKTPRHKHLSEQVSYQLTVESSLCLSWDDQQEVWTQHGCRTQQGDTTTAVNCSCHHLRPLTVVQQRIQCLTDTTDLDLFLSVSSDLTVLVVLVLCVCLYIPGWVACRRADVVSKANRRVHYLPDNSPQDPYLYAVTVRTGPCSAARMSAKVYIVLNGEDGVSQTKELQVPGCNLFRRNSQDTFIFSAADSLGPVWSVHIWHDNSGPSPTWYLKQVEVSEVSRGHVEGRAWLFVGQCWLAVNKGDGRVERTLRVCTEGIGFAKMLRLKLSDYLPDHHIWMSVHSCSWPNPFTHTQRLTVSMLLLLGYSSVNSAVISQVDDKLLLELGIIDVSAVSVTTGVFSVVTVLPAAALISFLFRLRELELSGPGVKHVKSKMTEKDFFEDPLSVTDSTCEPHLSWSSLQLWLQEAWRKKYQDTDVLPESTANAENKNTDKDPVIIGKDVFNVDQAPQGKESDLLSESSRFHVEALLCEIRDGGQVVQKEEAVQGQGMESSHHQAPWPGHSICYLVTNRLKRRRFRPVSQWCLYTAWSLCLLLSLSCLVLSAVLGTRFSSSQILLWIHSLFFSLMFCIFLIQPAMIITVAVIVSFWYRRRADFHSFSSIREYETSQQWSHSGVKHPKRTSASSQERCSYLEKLLGARQRARYLRLVRPPSPADLRKTRGKKRRDALLHKTLRDLSLCGSMLLLMLCINYSSSFADHYHLNKAVRKHFIRGHNNTFMSMQKQEDWWKWANSSLINLLYKNASAATESHILIGEPILWRTEVSGLFQNQVSGVTLIPDQTSLHPFLSQSRTSTHRQSSVLVPMATPAVTCGHLGCYVGPSDKVGLGHTKSDAASKLGSLCSGGWLGRQTVALKVQFTLFSPAPNLFTSVSMLAERSPTGVLVPSATVQSVRVYRTPATWDYVVMVCQLLFLLLFLLQLCNQVHNVMQQGLMGCWRTACSWLEVSLLAVTLVYYFYYIYHSTIILEVVELIQRRSQRGHVDVSLLATWEQCIRSLCGAVLFLLTVKCVTVLSVSRTLAPSATLLTRSVARLFWPTILGLIMMVVLSYMGNLLLDQSSWGFSSLCTLLCRYWGPRALKGLHFSWSNFLYWGVLYLSSTVVSTAMVVGVVSSLVRSAIRSQNRRNVFTVAELVGYIRQRVPDFTGQRRKAQTENRVEEKTYYFEEFESLVDELLFRLNALSNSLHHTLPPKAHRYREEDSPHTSPIQEPNIMDAQSFVRAQMTEKRTVNTDVSGHKETLPASHLLWSKPDWKILQERGHMGDSSSDIVVASDSQQPDRRAEENPKDRELQTYSKAQNDLSASLVMVWTEDVMEKQIDQWKKSNKRNWLNKSQSIHTEVVVDVLVHEDPGNAESDRHQGFHGHDISG